MTRSFLALFALTLVIPTTSAQPPAVNVLLSPIAEPQPALKYELLPSGRDRVSGNAAHHYLKANMYRPMPDPDRAKATTEEQRILKWEEADLDRFPAAEVRKHLERYAFAFRELEYGTRCKSCEWVSAPASATDAIGEAVGSVQSYREIARHLALRVKLEMAEKRYDDAVKSIRTGLQYGKHLAEGPNLIQMLVGYSVTAVMLERVDEFVARPDSPNLYWALSSLPRPFVDPRPALDGEDALNESFLPGLAELRKGPVSSERALEVAGKAVQMMIAANGADTPFADLGARLGLVGYAQSVQAEARKELVARGWNVKEVDAMPAVQVAFLKSFETYRELADDHRKWFLLPHSQAIDGMTKASARTKKMRTDKPQEMLLQVFLLILPAVEKVHQAGMRTDRKVALLRTVEAIRVHAAVTGRLPTELSDIRKVPVPPDPLTDKPFGYSVDGDTFTLTAPTPSTSTLKTLEMRYVGRLRR
jgi:hypothetical protein